MRKKNLDFPKKKIESRGNDWSRTRMARSSPFISQARGASEGEKYQNSRLDNKICYSINYSITLEIKNCSLICHKVIGREKKLGE